MEMTPEAIREVRFREKLRGYDHDDVDEFVGRLARTVESLQTQVREAEARAAEAEARAAEMADGEEALRRTLVLAQRTADAAIQEARDEAARMVSEAQAQRDAVVAEAEHLRGELAARAEADVRAELEQLQHLRSHLRAEVDALQHHLDSERARVRHALAELLAQVDAGALHPAPPPELVDVEVPPPPAPPAAEEAALPPEPAPPEWEEVEEPASPVADGDDPFMAELRRAVDDVEPLGPRDQDPAFPSPDDSGFDFLDERRSGRFGLRRRR